VSFIRNGENVKETREFLDKHGGNHIKIISKIENQEAIENLEDIAKLSDGLMVARGDLGIEMPIHQLPSYQKNILDMCFKYGKPVIVATELLKSMVHNPIPTRAEVSDVYNSVIMRADAVMLSDETTVGKYPVKAVAYMDKIVREAEKTTNNKHKDFDVQTSDAAELLKKAIARHALMLADEIEARMVVLFSYSGNLAKYVSSFKPNVPVISFTTNEQIYYSLGVSYGIFSEKVEQRGDHTSEDQETAINILKDKKMVKKGDYIIVISERVYAGANQPQVRIVPII
jgi:pyruvate kinase